MAMLTFGVDLPSQSVHFGDGFPGVHPGACHSHSDNEDQSPHLPTRQEYKWNLCGSRRAGHSLWNGKSISTELRP